MKRLIKKAEIKEMYHGTSSHNSESILATGIKIVDGGYGDGSYVSSSYEEARKYALKRAGDFRRVGDQYPQFAEVYPVIIVVDVDESELKHGMNDVYFAEEGISSDKIRESRDISDDPIWQDLLTYITFKDSEDEQEKNSALEAYKRYYNVVGSIV